MNHLDKIIIDHFKGLIIDHGLYVNDFKHEVGELDVVVDFIVEVFGGFSLYEVYILAVRDHIASSRRLCKQVENVILIQLGVN